MTRPVLLARARGALVGLGLLVDRGSWLEPDRLLACAYPRRAAALEALAAQGVSLLINLHTRAHDPARLARYGLAQVHLPVPDFAAPSPTQLQRGVAVLATTLAQGRTVAVHCGAGLGRTGTLLACYLLNQEYTVGEAIARVRTVRPGSVETTAQVAAIEAYAGQRAAGEQPAIEAGGEGMGMRLRAQTSIAEHEEWTCKTVGMR